MFLKQFLISSTHLTTSAGHHLGYLILVHLPSALLTTHNVFFVSTTEDHFSAFVGIQSELPTVT